MTQYTLAGHSVQVSGNFPDRNISSFLPFSSATSADEKTVLLLQSGIPLRDRNIAPLRSFPSAIDKNTTCSFAVTDSEYIIKIEKPETAPYIMEVTNQDGEFVAKTNMDEHSPGEYLHFCCLLVFGIAFAHHQTLIIHSSTVSYKGKAVLFLGESGTGKSTHSRLWLNHIPHTELINDDGPLVRIMEDGAVRVFGSPWSGKTPCYKNINAPVAAIVSLSQAPYNEIKPLKGIAALGALLPSCFKIFIKSETLLDKITDILSVIIKQIPVYHLDCLPNAEAAHLVFQTLKESGRL